jgi:hypothetical protein
LPGWLRFDATAGQFSGWPWLGDAGEIVVRVIGTDTRGLDAAATFTLTVAPDPHPWQNPGLAADARMDVNDDGVVAALDVLLVINHINEQGSGVLPRLPTQSDVARRALVDVANVNHEVLRNAFAVRVRRHDAYGHGWLLFEIQALPRLQLQPATRDFKPGIGYRENMGIVVRVVATDRGGLDADTTFTLTVTPDPHPWQNPGLTADARMDVDDDGGVAALDVLRVINYINAHRSGDLPSRPTPSDVDGLYVDVDGNNRCEPVDVLQVINYINERSVGEAEWGGGANASETLPGPAANVDGYLRDPLAWERGVEHDRVSERPAYGVDNGRAPAVSRPAAFASPGSFFDARPGPALRQPSSGVLADDLEESLSDIADDVSRALGIRTATDRFFENSL